MRVSVFAKSAIGFLSAVLLLSQGPCQAGEPRSIEVTLTDTGIQPGNIQGFLDHALHLHVTNRGRHLHQFSIPEFYVYSRTLQPGESSDITFAPYKTGRFPMISDPTGDNTPEFQGQVIVKNAP